MTDSGRPHAKAQERAPSRLQEAMSRIIREALVEDGATQADLARHLGISQKHLSRILNGRDEGTLALWSRALDLAGVCCIDLPLPDRVPFLGDLALPPEQVGA